MSRPPISNLTLSEHLTLSECHPDSECRTVNWWLYDERALRNVSMRAKTRDAAFVEAIDFWASRCARYEKELGSLRAQVNNFMAAISPPDED